MVILVVLLMVLFVMFLVIPSVMAATGECSRPHRDTANHEAQADRGRDFIDLDFTDLADVTNPG
ncbi:MAG: hypothetical protein ACXU9H_00970 [Candidatus Binataceae bacterium]